MRGTITRDNGSAIIKDERRGERDRISDAGILAYGVREVVVVVRNGIESKYKEKERGSDEKRRR